MLNRRSGVPSGGITKDELDIQDSLEPEVEYYDWTNTSAACISPVPSHPAYRSDFQDYISNRTVYYDTDHSDKTRLSFYLPKFQARLSSDIAACGYHISFSKFITHLVELGLITFQIDYHDQYQIVKYARGAMVKKLVNERTRNLYVQLDKMTISLGSIHGHRGGDSRHFTPSVPTWLYNAVSDVAVYLNMSKSDLVFLCWNIGMRHSISENYKSPLVARDIEDFMQNFEFELESYSKFVNDISSQMSTIDAIDNW